VSEKIGCTQQHFVILHVCGGTLNLAYLFICVHQDTELKSSLPLMLSNVTEPSAGDTQTSIIIEQEDGTEKHIVLARSQTTVGDNTSRGEYSCVCYCN